ncbi:MAG: TRAM domain-containing protein [Kofleriaceae bacterium]|nr:TRAM domain-containing protein [Kofleriaceae bacterium]
MTDTRRRVTRPPLEIKTLEVTSLAAGGDGVARDEAGRVTFVPRTAPGDRVRARLVQATKSFARGEVVELLAASPARVAPPCPHFERGCGGCTWQHLLRSEQLAAKQAVVAGALRKLPGLTVHPIANPAPDLGWRRRARFHVVGGKVGLYQEGTHRVLHLDHCPQLDPRLDGVLAQVAAASPPDGELALLLGHRGDAAVGVGKPWRGAERLVGKAAIAGVIAGTDRHGEPVLEVEPGLWGGPWDFAQASTAGNAALIARTRAAVGKGPGRLLELYAGAGNLTRGLVEDGWTVTASDMMAPAKPLATEYLAGPAASVLPTLAGPYDAIVLDPPRAGAAEAIDDIIRLAPPSIVYVSCDPATLARDAGRLADAGYRATDAWPIDLMPQTAHVEVVLRLQRA